MNETEIKQKTFKLFGFDEFPISELKKIDKALEDLGYSGEISNNGNIVYTKNKNDND